MAENPSAINAWAVLVIASMIRRGNRSASAPPTIPKNTAGSVCNMAAKPTQVALPVSRSITKASAIICTQTPELEIRAPEMNRR